MFLTEYNEAEVLEQEYKEGIEQARIETATEMLKDNEPLEKVVKFSKLSKDKVLSLAESLGIVLP